MAYGTTPGIKTAATIATPISTPPSMNHFKSVPPTNIITTPIETIRMVPDRCGSSSISITTTPSSTRNGQTP